MARQVKQVKRVVKHVRKGKGRVSMNRLTEAYEVRAFRDEETDRIASFVPPEPEIAHADIRAFEMVKDVIKGHGEQLILPDDCQFGDNDQCFVEA